MQVDRGDIGQVAPLFVDIQPVANDEFVWDGKAAVIDLDVALVALGLIQQGADFERARVVKRVGMMDWLWFDGLFDGLFESLKV